MNILKKRMRVEVKRWTVLSSFEILYFEIIYRLVGLGIIMQILGGIKSSVLRHSGLLYITHESIGELLRIPNVLFQIVVAGLLIAYYDYLELTTIVIYCEARWRGKSTSLLRIFKEALGKSVRIFHYKNLPIFIILLPIIAFSVLPIAGGYFNQFQVPEFIMDYIRENLALFIGFMVITAVINIVLFFYMFSIPAVILEGEYFWGSLHTSRELLKSKKIKTALYFVKYSVVWGGIVVLGFCSMVIILWGYSKVHYAVDGGRSLFQFYYGKWSEIGSIALHMLGSVILWPLVIYLYHRYKEEPETCNQQREAENTKNKRFYPIITVVTTVLLLGVYSRRSMGDTMYGCNELEEISIIAHRAGAMYAPENTVAALKEAIAAEAEIAEIDVQQTKDGVLVILHDTSFKRTTGLSQKVWETDYSTVATLDAGASFSSLFSGESVPTLEEMLEEAKDKIQLMVELKSTGHDENLVESAIEQIQAAEMEDQCLLASMDLELLKKAKEIAPSIETVYITTLLVSEDYNSSFIDRYSVETSFLTSEMIETVHSAGKKVYAWTANKEENIRKIIRLGADGLLTDNPILARYCLNTIDKDVMLEFLTNFLYGIE